MEFQNAMISYVMVWSLAFGRTVIDAVQQNVRKAAESYSFALQCGIPMASAGVRQDDLIRGLYAIEKAYDFRHPCMESLKKAQAEHFKTRVPKASRIWLESVEDLIQKAGPEFDRIGLMPTSFEEWLNLCSQMFAQRYHPRLVEGDDLPHEVLRWEVARLELDTGAQRVCTELEMIHVGDLILREGEIGNDITRNNITRRLKEKTGLALGAVLSEELRLWFKPDHG